MAQVLDLRVLDRCRDVHVDVVGVGVELDAVRVALDVVLAGEGQADADLFTDGVELALARLLGEQVLRLGLPGRVEGPDGQVDGPELGQVGLAAAVLGLVLAGVEVHGEELAPVVLVPDGLAGGVVVHEVVEDTSEHALAPRVHDVVQGHVVRVVVLDDVVKLLDLLDGRVLGLPPAHVEEQDEVLDLPGD